MNVDSVRHYCLSFPGVRENLQWGETLCFKVGGKLFATMHLGDVPPSMVLKCEPDKFAELLENQGIRPAPYVGRYRWAMLERLDVLSWPEVQGLIQQSYEMVAQKAPGSIAKAPRPRRMSGRRQHSSHHKRASRI